MQGTPFGKRLLLAIPASFFFSAYVFVSWFLIGFAIAGSTPGTAGETAGYATIVIVPCGAVVGMVATFVATLVPFGPRWWLRYAGLAAAFVLGGLVTFLTVAR